MNENVEMSAITPPNKIEHIEDIGASFILSFPFGVLTCSFVIPGSLIVYPSAS
jgi:hypothetical protein